MRRSPVILFLVVSLLAPACGLEIPRLAPAPPQPTGSTTPTTLDLADPDTQRLLGAGPPEGVEWSRQAAGVTVLGVRTRPSAEELELIEGAVEEMPAPLLGEASPHSIVRMPTLDEAEPHRGAASYARGTSIFFLDSTFQISPGGSTRLDLARAYAHELAHVAQFLTLEPSYLQAAFSGRVTDLLPAAGSRLVRDFAAATGWVDRSQDPLSPDWHLPPEVRAATDYGRTRPDEDMAESVAMVVMGRGDWIPPDRAGWVELWLGAAAEDLAEGKPWAPAGSREVLSDQPVYDEEEVARFAESHRHAEPLYFALPPDAPPHEELADELADRLRGRDLRGSLGRHEDRRLPRHAGLFTREDGVALWVELWDFREGEGFRERPDHPVLTYVVLW